MSDQLLQISLLTHHLPSPKSRIDTIVSVNPTKPKPPKEYCDKWLHDGTCAFTQQGCKFKHEMPLDTATQHAVGLFQGLPTWYKKHQEDLARQRKPPVEKEHQPLMIEDRKAALDRLASGYGPGPSEVRAQEMTGGDLGIDRESFRDPSSPRCKFTKGPMPLRLGRPRPVSGKSIH